MLMCVSSALIGGWMLQPFLIFPKPVLLDTHTAGWMAVVKRCESLKHLPGLAYIVVGRDLIRLFVRAFGCERVDGWLVACFVEICLLVVVWC